MLWGAVSFAVSALEREWQGLRPCHVLMFPPFMSVRTIQVVNLKGPGHQVLSLWGVMFSKKQWHSCLPCYVDFLIVPIHITFQTLIMKTLQNLTYNVVYLLDISGRRRGLRSSNI